MFSTEPPTLAHLPSSFLSSHESWGSGSGDVDEKEPKPLDVKIKEWLEEKGIRTGFPQSII
jgi:hypothetical protein